MVNVQCQAVFFGGSADNGYARLLQPYVGDNSKNKRIVLIEGPPFAKELARLKDKFSVASFPDLFRTGKLPARRVSFSTTPPRTPTPGSNAVSYAATAATPIDFPAARINDTTKPGVPISDPARRRYPLLQNSRGQRLDAILNPLPSLLQVERGRKLCNMFHILGECYYTKCSFMHGDRIDDKAIEARRLLARQAPCPFGLQCKDEKCLLGHQCPDKGLCARNVRGCRFSPEMHYVERT